MGNEKQPFFLLKTKTELLLSEERGQLVLEQKVKDELKDEKYKVNSLVGATITKNSPETVVDVKLVDSPEEFVDFVF